MTQSLPLNSIRSSIIVLAIILIISSCGSSGKPDSPSTADKSDGKPVELNEPPKDRLTKDELDTANKRFTQHFFVDKSTVPPDSQRHEFPWKEILRLRDEHPSNGLYFAYGLRGNNFIPVVSLFRGERTNYELVPGATFISDKTGLILRTITTQEIDRIAGEYLSRITTKLLNNPTPQPIKTDDLSTIGIYYTWPMLDTLFKHNKQIEETRKLVVTCISTQLAEGDFDLLENDEYRHTLSLHVAELMESGYQDRVRNDPTQEYFAYRAMNYGSVCPKNCPKR